MACGGRKRSPSDVKEAINCDIYAKEDDKHRYNVRTRIVIDLMPTCKRMMRVSNRKSHTLRLLPFRNASGSWSQLHLLVPTAVRTRAHSICLVYRPSISLSFRVRLCPVLITTSSQSLSLHLRPRRFPTPTWTLDWRLKVSLHHHPQASILMVIIIPIFVRVCRGHHCHSGCHHLRVWLRVVPNCSRLHNVPYPSPAHVRETRRSIFEMGGR
jgi:hypothetical protein